MTIQKAVAMSLTVVATSFFFFPFYFTFLPTVNTKMMMAACGLATYFIKAGKGRTGSVSHDLLMLTVLSLGVTAASYLTMTLNATPDDSYLYYFSSMWTWIGAAYFMVNMVELTHQRVSVELVVGYLVVVCTLQCFLALAIDRIPVVKAFIDSILDGTGYMGKNATRLYGLGCALDVAGSRFSAVLVLAAGVLPRVASMAKGKIYVPLLLSCFLVISVVGNMIARTTSLGMVLAVVYLLYLLVTSTDMVFEVRRRVAYWAMGLAFVTTVTAVTLYNTDRQWRENIDFGFEGFISLVEKGRWEVKSNKQLNGTFITPTGTRQWLIGDGHMGPTDMDPYYVGKAYHDFYMMTDVGYSRFLFYFGLIGLTAFSIVILRAAGIAMSRHSGYRLMFTLVCLVNFVVWFKVSSDIFLVFCPFLCFVSRSEDTETDLLHSLPDQSGRDGARIGEQAGVAL